MGSLSVDGSEAVEGAEQGAPVAEGPRLGDDGHAEGAEGHAQRHAGLGLVDEAQAVDSAMGEEGGGGLRRESERDRRRTE